MGSRCSATDHEKKIPPPTNLAVLPVEPKENESCLWHLFFLGGRAVNDLALGMPGCVAQKPILSEIERIVQFLFVVLHHLLSFFVGERISLTLSLSRQNDSTS